MGRFDGYLFCSDIDGTLTRTDGSISGEDARAIEYFCAEGGRFTLATGRYPEYAGSLPVSINAPLICINGTMIYDTKAKETLWQLAAPSEILADAASICREQSDLLLGAYICTGHKDIHISTVGSEHPEIPDVNGDTVYKVVFISGSRSNSMALLEDRLKSQYCGKYAFDRSSNTLLEMHHPESGKGAAVRALRKILTGINTVIAAGDNENDISMFSAADLSAAPANAAPEAKQCAKLTGPSHNDSFIAFVIKAAESGLYL